MTDYDAGDFYEYGGWNADKAAVYREQFEDFTKHVKINSKERGEMILGDSPYRSQLIFRDGVFGGLSEDKHDFSVLKSRQLGITTETRAFTLFWAGIHKGLRGAMVFDTSDHKEEARLELLMMVRELPRSLGFPEIVRENRGLVQLSNQTIINFASAGVKESKSSGTLGRSSGLNFLHASELCSWNNPSGYEALKNALAENFPDRLFIKESTARGHNIWKEMWDKAVLDTDHQVAIFIGWWAKDNQMIRQNSRDFERYGAQPPSNNEREKMRLVKDLYGWEISQEQLAWIRRKMDPTAEAEGDAPAEYEGDGLQIQEQPWCVTAETRVGTDQGMLRIEDACEGLQATLGKVTHAGSTGTARIWRATTKKGYQIRGTANHPLIDVFGNEVRIDESLGTKIRLQSPRFAANACTMVWRDGPVRSSIEITPDFARLVGLYMGDGSLQGAGKNGGAGYFCVTCDGQDQDVIDEVKRLLKAIFYVDAPTRKQPTNCVDVRVGSRLIVETFRRLGLARNDTVVTMRKIHVPEFIWRSPKHIVKEFLSGLFEADGYNGWESHRVALFSKYPAFIRDVQQLLLAFGITSRSVSMQKKTGGKGQYTYTGNQLELRKLESIKFNEEIGFISARKRGRHTGKPYRPAAQAFPIVMEDEVVSVVDEGVDEEVFNLTVEGAHLFDANGILTHNTAEEAFQVTGATFFDPAKLTEIANKYTSKNYKTYAFSAGIEFADMRAYPAPNSRSVQLKIWEEPDPDGVYIVSVDPAFGMNENNDRSTIEVTRAYADGIDQVAEYAWPLINTRQLAWVVATLLGYYKECYLIVELNGPGEAVWLELQSLKRNIANSYQTQSAEEKGLTAIFANVKNYMYNRADSMTPGRAYHMVTTSRLKVSMMERLRDFTSNGMLIVRSMETLEEMRAITREGDTIEAAGTTKDDRVMALALGVRCWEDRARKVMSPGKRTRENEAAKKRLTIKDQIMLFNNAHLDSFFATKKRQRSRANSLLRKASWRSR